MIARMDGLRWLVVLGTALVVTGCNSVEAENRKLRAENERLRSELEGNRAAMEGAMSQRSQLEEQNRRLQDDLAKKPVVQEPVAGTSNTTPFSDISGVESFQDANRVTVRVAGDILFDSGKTELKSTARKTLGDIAGVIQKEYPGKMIRISGYTDTDPIRKSKWSDNLELSAQRAIAVHRELQKAGVPPSQMYAAGYGEWQPRDTKALSRRVEIVVELN